MTARPNKKTPDQKTPVQKTPVQIAIAGSGLTAMVMALALAETGYQIVFFPAAETPARPDSRTTTIHAAGQRMLDCLGLWQALPILPAPISRIKLAEGRPQRGGWSLDFGDGTSPMAYTAENSALLTACQQLLEGEGRVLQAASPLDTLSWQEGRPVLRDAAGQLWQPDLLVACDGRDSPARQAAGLKIGDRPAGQTALVGRLGLGLPHQDTAWQRFLPGGPLALMPLPENRAAMVWSLPPEEADRLAAGSQPDFEAELMAAFGDALGQMRLLDRLAKWPLRPSFVPKRTHSHLVLAGDAAHALHPLAGMGFNLALSDAAVLADCLAAARQRGLAADHASILADYEQRRVVETAALSAVTEGLNRLFSTDLLPLFPLPIRPPIQSFGRMPLAARALPARLAGIGMTLLGRSAMRARLSDIAMGGVLARASLLDGKLPR